MDNHKNTGQDRKPNNRPWWNTWWAILLKYLIAAGVIFLILWPDRVNAKWNVLFAIIRHMEWPFAVLMSVIILHRPLGYLISNLGDSLGKLRQLKIGKNLAFSTDEIIGVLIDREILKMGILMAHAEGGISPPEADDLLRLASPMKSEVQRLSKEQKIQVLDESINMALIDGEIQKQEYVRIRELADLYNQDAKGDDKVDVDKLVVLACYYQNVKPPEQLTNYYAQKVEELEKIK